MNFKDVFSVGIISFLIVMACAPLVIPYLRNLKFGQTVREEGPKSHLAKNGTPTMGGVMMIFSILITSIAYTYFLDKKLNMQLLIAILCTLGFGFVGFIDDYIKVVMKRSLGLRAYQKILGQVFLAFFVSYYSFFNFSMHGKLLIPFIKNFSIDLGYLYIPFVAIVIIAIVNSVNLTDGLDGLSSGVTIMVTLFFVFFSIKFNNSVVGIISASLLGSCVGFLKYNKYPAKVFMGDTGSMALGGAVAALAVLTGTTLFIPIVGGIYFAESLSVIIQVISFKTTGKRIFKMSPIHHHFELCGWKETKVVRVFWTTALVLALIGIFAI